MTVPVSGCLWGGGGGGVPASRVAMDTSLSAYGFCSPLTLPARVPKLIDCDEFKFHYLVIMPAKERKNNKLSWTPFYLS